jgi:Zn-dependent peptidase ImmA (M78 family)
MNRGHKVSPLSTDRIRKVAHQIRDTFQIVDGYIPIVLLIELLHQQELIEFEIVEQALMPDDYGLTFPKKGKIVIRQDVYDLAVSGDGFGRFTIAHELGHLILHNQEVVYARNKHGGHHKTFEDSEWQADKFAQELLVDVRHVSKGDQISDIECKFGVSRKAAEVSFKALKNGGIL